MVYCNILGGPAENKTDLGVRLTVIHDYMDIYCLIYCVY